MDTLLYKEHYDAMRDKIKEMDIKQKIRLAALFKLQQQVNELNEKQRQEIDDIQSKYEDLSLPLFQKSSQLIQGQRLPTADELDNFDSYLTKSEIEQKDQIINHEDNLKQIPQYWLKALKTSTFISCLIQQHDEKILQNLVDVVYEPVKGSNDFSVIFIFQQNEFFKNTQLKKTFYFKEDDVHSKDFPYKCTADTIEWHEGKDVTKKITKKKNKKTKKVKEIVVNNESFFNVFRDLEPKLDEKPQEDEVDDEEMEANADIINLEQDYQMIAQIVQNILPSSFSYYLGIPDEDEDEGCEAEDDCCRDNTCKKPVCKK